MLLQVTCWCIEKCIPDIALLSYPTVKMPRRLFIGTSNSQKNAWNWLTPISRNTDLTPFEQREGYMTLFLRQEIRIESIDPVEMTRQRIIVLKLSLMKNSRIRSSIVYSVWTLSLWFLLACFLRHRMCDGVILVKASLSRANNWNSSIIKN